MSDVLMAIAALGASIGFLVYAVREVRRLRGGIGR